MPAPAISPSRALWGLSALALALRLGAAWALVDLGAEAYAEYGMIADHLNAGRGFSMTYYGTVVVPSAYMPPGYAGLVALVTRLDPTALQNAVLLGLQALAGAGCVPLAFAATRRWAGDAAGLGAAATVAVLPTFVVASVPYSATAFFHLGLLALLAGLARRPTAAGAAGLGALMAALVLVRTEFVLFAGLALALMAWRWNVRAALPAALSLALVLTPWVARNAVVLGQPTLSTGLGTNLYRGHNPAGVGAWATPEVSRQLRALPAGPGLEAARSRLLVRASLDHVRARPARAASDAAVKAFRLWTLDPGDPRARRLPVALSWALLVGLAVVGARRRRPPPEVLWFLAYSTLVAAVFFALARHQILMGIALVPPAGVGAAAVAARLTRR